MVKWNSVDSAKFCQIIFVRGIVAMPSCHIEWRIVLKNFEGQSFKNQSRYFDPSFKPMGKEIIALSCPLWLLYRGTANQPANQWKKSWVEQSVRSLHFLSKTAAARLPVQQPKNSKRVSCALSYTVLGSIYYALDLLFWPLARLLTLGSINLQYKVEHL